MLAALGHPSALTEIGIAALVLVAVALITYLVMRIGTYQQSDIAKVIEPYRVERVLLGDDDVEPAAIESPEIVTVPALRRTSRAIDQAVGQRGPGRHITALLDRADVSINRGDLLLIWLVGGVLLTAVGFLVARIAGGVIVLFLVAVGPPTTLQIMADRRTRLFEAQLPDVLKLIASSLRAGFSFMQSLDGVVRQIKDPAQESLLQVLSEVRLGKALEDALYDAAERIQNKDFSEAVLAVRIQQETGGNLAALLDLLADTMTQRLRLRREIRTLTAEGRITAFVLGLLPLALGLFLYSVNRSYVLELFHSLPGEVALVVAFVLELVGFFWMYRIVKIEV